MPDVTGVTHHIKLAGKGYMVKKGSYRVSPCPTAIGRLVIGEASYRDLADWSYWGIKDWSGGAFQDELEKGAAFSNSFNIDPGKDLRLMPRLTTQAGSLYDGETEKHPTAHYHDYLYLGVGTSLFKASGGNWTAVKTDFATDITDLCVHKDNLWVARGASLHFYDGTTWSNPPKPTSYLASWRDKLYRVGSVDKKLYSSSDNFVSETDLGIVGNTYEGYTGLVVYNDLLYIGKQNGLYASNGTLNGHFLIVDFTNKVSPSNFNCLTVHQGALYFVAGNTLWRLVGSTLESLIDFKLKGVRCYGMASTGTSLYLIISYYLAGQETGGLFLYREEGLIPQVWEEIIGTRYRKPRGLGIYGRGATPIVYWTDFYELDGASWGNYSRSLEGTKEPSSRALLGWLMSSNFERFPAIDKYWFDLILETTKMPAGSSVVVALSYDNGSTWPDSFTASFTDQEVFRFLINKLSRSLKYKITMHAITDTTVLKVKSLTFRYSFLGRNRRRYQFLILSQEKLELLDASGYETVAPENLLAILQYYKETQEKAEFEPLGYVGENLTAGMTTTQTTIPVTTTAFPEKGRVRIEAEEIYYSGKSATELTGCTRGANLTQKATHVSGTLVSQKTEVKIADYSVQPVILENEALIGVVLDEV